MALPPTTANIPSASSSAANKSLLFPFIMVTSLFFFWGFIHNLDPALIAHFKKGFQLNTLQVSLVDSAVYFGYFVMAIPAGLLMKKYGYKTGILIGLSFFAFGCFLFIPAANAMLYPFFLVALFIVACGLAILETAANPYATLLGPPETATFRLNFAQSFNGLAAFLAPLIGRYFILSKDALSDSALNALQVQERNAYLLKEVGSVKMPYTVLGLAILVVAIIFFFTKLPDIKDSEEKSQGGFFHVLRHKQLKWGVIAQFFYVGAQVCILSFLLVFANKAAGLPETDASIYSSIAGGAFLAGRFAGTFFMRFIAPAKLLTAYAVICTLLCLIIIFASGVVTLYASIGVAFFMSIMFPTIFALGIQDIGADTKAGSSLLIMSIVGGAILPPILAYIDLLTGHFQYGYVVPLVSFLVIFYFGWKGHRHEEKAVEALH